MTGPLNSGFNLEYFLIQTRVMLRPVTSDVLWVDEWGGEGDGRTTKPLQGPGTHDRNAMTFLAI